MSRTPDPANVARSLAELEAQWKPAAAAPDGMTLDQLKAQREALRTALRRLDDIQPCCLSCARFDFGKTCTLHGEVPHEYHQAIGQCPDWLHDGIPF